MNITKAEQTYLELVEKLNNKIISKSEHELLEAIQLELARNNFKFFCYLIRPYYKWMWFHKYIMERLQSKVLPITDYDKEHSRYLLRMGDQHGKTELACRLFPAWCLGKFPNKRIIFLTYSDERAKQPTRELINILITPIYQRIFPEFRLPDDMEEVERQAEKSGQKLTNRFFTNANSPKEGPQGSFLAAGLTATYLGNSGEIIICDDLFSQTEASSQRERENKWEVFSASVVSRQQKNTPFIVAGTWWNRDDIIGRIEDTFITNESELEEGTAKWELTEFNSQKDDRDYPYDPRKYGEYLWPEERLQAYLDQKQLNPRMWQIKHQNLPPDKDGVLFTVNSFRVYDQLPTAVENMKVVISIDSNYKVTNTSDHAGITVWAIYAMNAYLLEFKNKKYKMQELLEETVSLVTKKYPKYHSILVELKAQGQPFVDMAPLYGLSRVEGFEPAGKGDKRERAEQVLPIFNSGQVHVPNVKLCSNINFLTNQFISFTGENGRADDLVDTATQMFMHYDYLFRGVPAIAPITISKEQILRGNLQRLAQRKGFAFQQNQRFGMRH